MRPTFTILLATIGRPTLARTLASIRSQELLPGDEVLLVSDGPSAAARRMFADAILPGRVVEVPGPFGDWGHTPRNLTMPLAYGRTSHLMHMDDDDSYVEGALTTVRDKVRADPDRPHLFRIVAGQDDIWPKDLVDESGRPISPVQVGNVGTPEIVHPAREGTHASWMPYHGGDGAFIVDTCGLFPQGPAIHRDIIVRLRS